MTHFNLKSKGTFEVEQIIDQPDGSVVLITTRSVSKMKPLLYLKGYKVFKITKKQSNSMTYVSPSEFESLYEAQNESKSE